MKLIQATAFLAVLWETNLLSIPSCHKVDAFVSNNQPIIKTHNIQQHDKYTRVFATDKGSSSNTTNERKTKNHKTSKTKNPTKHYNNNNNHQRKRNGKKNSSKINERLLQAKAINQKLIQLQSAQEVLEYFISMGGAKGKAGGNVFNSVNFSTCFHRLARFATFVDYSKKNNHNHNNNKEKRFISADEQRKMILADPRMAILISSLSEALVEPSTNQNLIFNNRELANLGWAIAKIKLAPPSNIYPIIRPIEAKKAANEDKYTKYVTMDEMNSDILETSLKVRQQVFEVAKERNDKKGAVVQSKWIPTMSQLSGKLLDNLASQSLVILSKFNSQELANLLYAFASAGRADAYFFDQLANQLVENINKSSMIKQSRNGGESSRPKPQEFSNSIWAFASAGIRCNGQEKLMKCVAEILDENDGEIVKDFKPQELSNTAWGIATLISKRNSNQTDEENSEEDQSAIRILRWVAKSLIERIEDFKPQEISNSIWAFATLGFGATTSTGQFNTNNEYISLPSSQPELDRKLVSEALLVVAKNAKSRLNRFRPQELNNMVWGYCRLGHYTDEMMKLYEGVGQEILQRHRQFAPQDIGTTLWSFATVEYYDEAVYKAAVSELTLTKSPSFKPQELSNTVWALATAGAVPKFLNAFDSTTIKNAHRVSRDEIIRDPITACIAAATTELMKRPHEFKEQEIKDVLWSLSKVGMRHPLVFKKVAEHLVGAEEGENCRGLSSFSPQGLGNLAWSYAKQGQLAEGGSESLIGSTGRLAVYETISRDLGDELIRRLFTRIAETSINSPYGLTRSKPQDLSNTCWAFATLGLLHRGFFAAVGDQLEFRLAKFNPDSDMHKMLSRFKGQEIANLLWAFATLNYRKSKLMDDVTPYILHVCSDGRSKRYDERSISRSFKRQEIANIAWSCAVLEQYPKQLMPLLYTALFGEDGSNPELIRTIYSDEGIQRQAVMTMFYVQMALDMEAPGLKLRLPLSFPMKWVESANVNSNVQSPDGNENASLQLTTSRLQSKVGNVLDRLGFDHVEEHVISTNGIERSHNIVLSEDNQEVLSIDMADVDKLIGLEVDGPGHFITVLDDESGDEESLQMNGPTSLKDRLLNHLGWSVIHIPYYEWRELKGDDEAEDNYMQTKLQNVK